MEPRASVTEARTLIVECLKTGIWANEEILSILKPLNLSLQQFNVLRILRGCQGKPVNLSHIQELMISKMSNTTRLVDKLVKKEWVHRVVSQENRRKVNITITKDGLEILKELDPIIDKHETKMVGNLTKDEAEHLTFLLKKMKL